MTPVVKAKLDSVFKYPFFSSVGQLLPSTVSRVDTWPQAVNTCGFLKWENNRLAARNTLQEKIQARFQEDTVNHYFWHRLQEWNPLIHEVQAIVDPFIHSLVQKIPLKDKNLQKLKDNIVGDIKLILLEIHFQDIVKPIFYLPHLDPWYAAGHFPCGWDGDEFPEQWDGVIRGGQLIVF
jgi:hypothetical protein